MTELRSRSTTSKASNGDASSKTNGVVAGHDTPPPSAARVSSSSSSPSSSPSRPSAVRREMSTERVDRGRIRSGLEVSARLHPVAPWPLLNARSRSELSSPSRARRTDVFPLEPALQIPRKLLHSSISVFAVYLWQQHPNVTTLLRWSLLIATIIVVADLIRFKSPAFELTYEKYLGYLMREHERESVNGTIYYFGGVLFCLTFLPRDIATLSCVMLSLCDTTASVFGRLYGKYTPKLPFSGTLFGRKKSLAGTLAAVMTGTLAAYYFWGTVSVLGDEGDSSWLPARKASTWVLQRSQNPTRLPRLPSPNSTLSLPALSVVCGLIAGVAEAIDVFGLDDNLTLPVLFGLIAWAVMTIIA
ncbi:BZ3500_MvSof-1268-A1-R1_Chr2-1g04629 [Microbotryum saponariae]|uniref:BZ3500_MvSof-1268-A1-R1_Chr2-1g04629 protein n=1 Tax=Microbotryum saponariae TaxID=289078 RepID=A0A2X0KG37_9BASI|nr:BZ3500_MvSof-1268-A1-R1_Chr2-1g04629 [Microbotryum saponariae]SCZ92149.1 BZ3501_MvSof-1269-A2-R1_Chr2-1g04285 [Microbotryum saponariae]